MRTLGVESENNDRETALMVCGACQSAALPACGHDCTEITKLLLAGGANVKARDKSGRDALGAQAFIGHDGAVTDLASVSTRNARGMMPLHLAVASETDRPEIARLLLEHGADKDAVIESKDGLDGVTALSFASMRGGTASAKLLLDAGTSVTLGPPRTAAPLHYAAAMGRLELVKLLLERGAPIDQPNP